MNLKNIFTTALGCFAVLAACGNDNDSDVTPTPDQPTEEAKDVTIYVTNTSRTYDLKKPCRWDGVSRRRLSWRATATTSAT